MKQRLKQNQKLKLSPKQIQFLGLLQIPITSLEHRIEEELEKNPALEEEIAEEEEEGFQQEYNFQKRYNLDFTLPPIPEKEQTLYDSLINQILLLSLAEREHNLAKYLKDKDIYTSFRYYPLHKIELYKEFSLPLKNAEEICDTTINIPIHQNLSNKDVNYIVDTIKNFRRNK